jgi:sugar lactone lactonase YvrE
MKSRFAVGILALALLLGAVAAGALDYEVVGTVTNPDLKMDGVAWDGKNIWVVTYQSSPVKWEIVKLDDSGKVLSSFTVPVDSLDDIHNFGMTNITSDGRTIWANHWNEGLIYNFSKNGKIRKTFGVPSVNQLIPVGIAVDGRNLWVLHWSNKTLYHLDTNGKELGSVSLRRLAPPPDMGMAWDGKYFWVANMGANRIHRITPEGEAVGMIKGPRDAGGIRDLDWDGEHLLLVYKQDSTVYKLRIIE